MFREIQAQRPSRTDDNDYTCRHGSLVTQWAPFTNIILFLPETWKYITVNMRRYLEVTSR